MRLAVSGVECAFILYKLTGLVHSPLRALLVSCRLKRLRSPLITTVSALEKGTQVDAQPLIRETASSALFPL